MALLIDQRSVALASAALVGGTFFLLEALLSGPLFWKAFAKLFSRPGGELHDIDATDFRQGMRFRVVCAVHNTTVSALALAALTDRRLWEDSLQVATPLSQLTVLISCGFFLWDVTQALKQWTVDDPTPLLHGVICFSFLFYILWTEKCHFYGCASILWEISTPFLHVRWCLYKIGMEQTAVYLYNGLSMLATYAIFRIAWGTYVAAKFWLESAGSRRLCFGAREVWLLRSFCLIGMVLNYFWFWKMLILSYKAFLERKEAQHKHS